MSERLQTAVIAAAGSGQRLRAGGPKAFMPLGGEPLLLHAVRAAATAASIGPIVIAAPTGAEERARECVASAAPGTTAEVVAGGTSRAESVRAALAAVATDLVLVHDAARPLAAPALFDAIVSRLQSEPDAAAVIAATPIVDTVKRVGGSGRDGALRVTATEAREELWAAQTPQGFRTAALRAAAERLGERELTVATDEARLVELAGGRVLIEPAPARNLKITTPEDLDLAEALLAADQGVVSS